MTCRRATRVCLLCTGCLALVALFRVVPASCDEKKPQKRWSVRWEAFWPQELAGERQSCRRPHAKVTSSAGVVALAVGRSCEASSSSGTLPPVNRPFWLMVLFLDATNGRLLAKTQPQLADSGFNLFATASGNFIVCLRKYKDAATKQGDFLMLLSPAGKTMKSAEMESIGENSRSRRWQVFLSPSKKTLLVAQVCKSTTFYQVLDTDTLLERTAWESQDQSEPIPLSVSDKELLGLSLLRAPATVASGRPEAPEIYIKAFEGSWRLLFPAREHLSYRYAAFLNDGALTALDVVDRPEKESFVRIHLARTDGQEDASKVLKKSSWSDLGARRQIESSPGDNSIALGISSTSRFWETLDFYPTHSEILVLKTNDLESILRIKNDGRPNDFALLPDGSQLVVLDGSSLVAYALH